MSIELEEQPRRDEELLAGAGGLERAGFEELVARYQDRVAGYLCRLTGDPDKARDLVQDTFLKVWQSRERFEGRCSVNGWIFRIATNTYRDAMRRTGSDPLAQPAGGNSADSLGNLHDLATRADGPREQLAKHERQQALENAIGELSPLLRAVLLLSVREDLSYAEIAEALDIPKGTVSSRKAQAVAILRKRLNHEDDEQ